MELKCGESYEYAKFTVRSNRTFMELKFQSMVVLGLYLMVLIVPLWN